MMQDIFRTIFISLSILIFPHIVLSANFGDVEGAHPAVGRIQEMARNCAIIVVNHAARDFMRTSRPNEYEACLLINRFPTIFHAVDHIVGNCNRISNWHERAPALDQIIDWLPKKAQLNDFPEVFDFYLRLDVRYDMEGLTEDTNIIQIVLLNWIANAEANNCPDLVRNLAYEVEEDYIERVGGILIDAVESGHVETADVLLDLAFSIQVDLDLLLSAIGSQSIAMLKLVHQYHDFDEEDTTDIAHGTALCGDVAIINYVLENSSVSLQMILNEIDMGVLEAISEDSVDPEIFQWLNTAGEDLEVLVQKSCAFGNSDIIPGIFSIQGQSSEISFQLARTCLMSAENLDTFELVFNAFRSLKEDLDLRQQLMLTAISESKNPLICYIANSGVTIFGDHVLLYAPHFLRGKVELVELWTDEKSREVCLTENPYMKNVRQNQFGRITAPQAKELLLETVKLENIPIVEYFLKGNTRRRLGIEQASVTEIIQYALRNGNLPLLLYTWDLVKEADLENKAKSAISAAFSHYDAADMITILDKVLPRKVDIMIYFLVRSTNANIVPVLDWALNKHKTIRSLPERILVLAAAADNWNLVWYMLQKDSISVDASFNDNVVMSILMRRKSLNLLSQDQYVMLVSNLLNNGASSKKAFVRALDLPEAYPPYLLAPIATALGSTELQRAVDAEVIKFGRMSDVFFQKLLPIRCMLSNEFRERYFHDINNLCASVGNVWAMPSSTRVSEEGYQTEKAKRRKLAHSEDGV